MARFLALFCLLSVSSSIGRSEASGPFASSVAVYFKGTPASSTLAFNSMRTELAALLNGAAYTVQWGDAQIPVVNGGQLVVVELRGTCLPSSPANIAEQPSGSPLASSEVANERILPFISLDCKAVSDLLGSAIAELPAGQRDLAYGRAMARLLAHELYHFLTQTTHHTKSGIAKASVTAGELLSKHFDFDGEAFARLHDSLHPALPHTAMLAKPGERGL